MSDTGTGGKRAPGRTGEKAGWTGGWLGGFLWLLILSVVWLVQGRLTAGTVGLGLFVLGVGAILLLAPWRHPATPQWKLMLPVYCVFFISVAWALWAWGDPARSGLTWWSFFWVLPCLIPLWTAGRRRWEDGNG